jgi:hypothetical protein
MSCYRYELILKAAGLSNNTLKNYCDTSAYRILPVLAVQALDEQRSAAAREIAALEAAAL